MAPASEGDDGTGMVSSNLPFPVGTKMLPPTEVLADRSVGTNAIGIRISDDVNNDSAGRSVDGCADTAANRARTARERNRGVIMMRRDGSEIGRSVSAARHRPLH